MGNRGARFSKNDPIPSPRSALENRSASARDSAACAYQGESTSSPRHSIWRDIETDTADQLHDRGVRFHESLVEASGNPFFIDTVRRVNRVRRLLSYRSMQDRKRYKQHCQQHLHLLDLLARDRNQEASDAMREHLQSTLKNLTKIRELLKP